MSRPARLLHELPGPHLRFRRSYSGRRENLLVPALLAIAGCGPGPRAEDASAPFSLSDSAGVQIAVTRGADARAPLGWVVDAAPDLVLGTGDEPSAYLFRVQGVRGLPDGRILVVDGGSQELRFFDPRGRLVKRAGGRGQGPGEFRDPILVPVPGMDSIFLFDTRLPYFQVFSPEGEYARTIRHDRGWPRGRRAPVGGIGFRHLLFNASGTYGGPYAPREETRAIRKFIWYDQETGERVTADSAASELVHVERSGRRWDLPVIFRKYAAVSQEGAFITQEDAPEIREIDVEGRLRRILRISDFSRPVPRELIESRLDQAAARAPRIPRRELERVYGEMHLPEALPAFQSLRIDEHGWLWAEIYEWDPARSVDWMLFDPEGRAHGTVSVPPGLSVEWIGSDFILGVSTDDFGVEHVRRHVLRRQATTTTEDDQ